MLRDRWEFKVSAKQLREALYAKIAYHGAKAEEWARKVTTADEDVRLNGLDTRQVLDAVAAAYASTSYAVNQPVLDQVKVKALNEAQKRLEYHRSHLAEYQGWLKALEYTTAETFSLFKEDLTFFGLDRS